MSKFSVNVTRNDNQHPNETNREYMERRLVQMFEDVFYQASGRAMHPDFKTTIQDAASDVSRAMLDTVYDEERQHRSGC